MAHRTFCKTTMPERQHNEYLLHYNAVADEERLSYSKQQIFVNEGHDSKKKSFKTPPLTMFEQNMLVMHLNIYLQLDVVYYLLHTNLGTNSNKVNPRKIFKFQ